MKVIKASERIRIFFPAQRHTRLPGGYMGKILRVDLSKGELLYRTFLRSRYCANSGAGNSWPNAVYSANSRSAPMLMMLKNVIVGMTGPITGTGLISRWHQNKFCLFKPGHRLHIGAGGGGWGYRDDTQGGGL